MENVDYVGFAIMANGNETTDFALTIDLAKKLAMQVRTDKGEMVKQADDQYDGKLRGLTRRSH